MPARRRFTVPERIDVAGHVRRPLDEAAVHALLPALVAAGVESVAVALMHSYANPAHERRIAACSEALPASLAHLLREVCPEIREYERISTACANAYVQPLMAGYIGGSTKPSARPGSAARST